MGGDKSQIEKLSEKNNRVANRIITFFTVLSRWAWKTEKTKD